MAKGISKGSGGGLLMRGALLEEDFGLQFTLPAKSDAWLNEPGEVPASRGQIQDWTRAFVDTLSTLAKLRGSGESTEGVLNHRLGTALREFRGHAVWKTLGISSFEAFCEQHLGISVRTAYRFVFFAAVTTEAEAASGVRKCLAGVALAGALGLEGLTALTAKGPDGKEPAAWAKKLGEPVDFEHSTAARLERLLQNLVAPALPAKKPSPRVSGVVAARQVIIERLSAKHPALVTLGVKSYAFAGKARITHRPATSDEECSALAAMYAAFAKA